MLIDAILSNHVDYSSLMRAAKLLDSWVLHLFFAAESFYKHSNRNSLTFIVIQAEAALRLDL